MKLDKYIYIVRRDLHRLRDEVLYFLLRCRYRNGLIIKNIQGSKMHLDLKDKGISKDLILNGIREARGTEIMHSILEPGQVIVDIGANIGYYALMEAKIVGPSGKVYAIEPVSENVDILIRNVKINDYKNVDVYHLAIGSTEGLSKIYLSDRRNWHSMINNDDNDRSEEIQVVRLDTFLLNKLKPDLVRMDVEGFEGEIIKGMVDTLSSTRNMKLFIEVHPHIMKKDDVVLFFKTLENAGYEVIVAADRQRNSYPKMKDILEDDAFLEGRRGGLLIFFGRKNLPASQ